MVGHASAHQDDLDAQLEETLTNLEALLASAGMPAGLRYAFAAEGLRAPSAATPRGSRGSSERLPGMPVLLLHGDICRSELLVEIDGWRYA